MKKILIICTGNSCRSQMAEGFLKSFGTNAEVYSAGTRPENEVNPYAIVAMKEKGIDIGMQKPENIDQFLDETFDYVITVCDHAKESCPVFTGKVGKQMHIGFEDPALATGTDEEKMIIYRKVRDQIEEGFHSFYNQYIGDGNNK